MKKQQTVSDLFERVVMFFTCVKITTNDKNILAGYKDVELADMANKLNCWEWPECLPDEDVKYYTKNSRRKQLMEYIEGKVGKKLINRRCNKDRMTDQEHEEFWNSDRNIFKT